MSSVRRALLCSGLHLETVSVMSLREFGPTDFNCYSHHPLQVLLVLLIAAGIVKVHHRGVRGVHLLQL